MSTSYIVTVHYNVNSHATCMGEDLKRGLDALIMEAGGEKYWEAREDLASGDVVHTFEYARLATSDTALAKLRKVTRNRQYCAAFVVRDKVTR